MKIIKSNPIGYCGGVKKAIDVVLEVIEHNSNNYPIYCMGPIVHNKKVNDFLERKGVIFVDKEKKQFIEKINNGIIIFTAHGTDPCIIDYAKKKGLIVYDTTCYFVKKNMQIINNKINEDAFVIFIGKKGHPESEAVCSLSTKINLCENQEDIKLLPMTNKKVVVTNQTTIAIDTLNDMYEEIKKKYDDVLIIDEICNATRIRQVILKKNAKFYDGILVVGDEISNNTKSLYKTALNCDIDSIITNEYNQKVKKWAENKNKILIVSGTSTPISVIDGIFHCLKSKKN